MCCRSRSAGYQQQVSASGINNSRTVVGSITNEFATQFAFVYNEATGLRNLNNLCNRCRDSRGLHDAAR